MWFGRQSLLKSVIALNGMVYEPREDSYFLAEHVRKHARGKVLDMCAGSGVQAKAALQNPDVENVLAVDIDERSVERVKEELKVYGNVTVQRSDLFSGIGDERFDTIICNPPYLPQDPGVEDAELYGGPNGWEFTERFLREARSYLSPGGRILLLFSSLTNRERLERAMKEFGYGYRELGQLAMFFERLFVYEVYRAD